MEKGVENPTLVERHCGGWLAISGGNEPVEGGVTAGTEAAAIELFAATIRAWRRNLEAERGISVNWVGQGGKRVLISL